MSLPPCGADDDGDDEDNDGDGDDDDNNPANVQCFCHAFDI